MNTLLKEKETMILSKADEIEKLKEDNMRFKKRLQAFEKLFSEGEKLIADFKKGVDGVQHSK